MVAARAGLVDGMMGHALAKRAGRPRGEAKREGFDGTEVFVRERPIPGTSQVQTMAIRSRPGSFVWRYARAAPQTLAAMLYHAGVEFGRLWERAGMDGPATVDWARSGVVQWRGLPPSKIMALDSIRPMVQELGKMVATRLVHYVVQEKTTGELAALYGFKDREMGAILEADLCAAAQYFKYG